MNCKANPRLLAAALLLLPALAGAQKVGLEEIIVTATRRGENIRDIPMSVEVISGIMTRVLLLLE